MAYCLSGDSRTDTPSLGRADVFAQQTTDSKATIVATNSRGRPSTLIIDGLRWCPPDHAAPVDKSHRIIRIIYVYPSWIPRGIVVKTDKLIINVYRVANT